MFRRVVVTGMGIISCLGSGCEANWGAVCAGKSGIGPITLFDTTQHQTKIAGEVRGECDPEGFVPLKEVRRMDRFQHLALIATGEAVKASGLEFPFENPYKAGVILGSGMGGLATVEAGTFGTYQKGPKSCHPLLIPKAVINLAPAMVAIRYGLKGPNFGVVNACTSGSTAIGEAFRMVREGRTEIMVTGGAEAVVTPLSIASFNALRALSVKNDPPEKASRPFDLDRSGFVISEGAGILILENYEHAVSRGAKMYGEIIGYGATDDAYHFVMPDPEGEGAYYSMKSACEDAGIEPTKIDYINAHGTSTELNDKMETDAIKRLLGKRAYNVAVSSTKSMTGHLIGAAGAVEAIFSLLAIQHGIVPPTINLETPDPACDLNYTPNTAVKREISYAMSNSFAFGGQNATLIFSRV